MPQTYDFTRGTARAGDSGARTECDAANARSAWAKRDMAVPLASPREALILASIVQAESPVEAELPEIAAVYENRLAMGMKLQADPTVIYAASQGAVSGGAGITRADLANPSAYNTYVYVGPAAGADLRAGNRRHRGGAASGFQPGAVFCRDRQWRPCFRR